MTKEQEEFIKLLKDMFQFDQADLDFGIYKIMNAKRDEINRFLNEDLPHYIKEGLSVLESSTTREQINNIDEQIAIIKKGNLPEVVKEQTLAGLEKQKEELKFVTSISTAQNEIYNHLLNFFSRYYDEGDFIFQRRYSKDNAVLDAFFAKKHVNPLDFEYKTIYVNGDNNLQNIKTDNETWKVVLIESEMKKRMFSEM